MSRKTDARTSPSRKVRTRPGCSSTYHRPSAAWNAPVICVNASPPNTRCSLIAGMPMSTGGATVGAAVGAAVGGCGVGVGDGIAVADGSGVGATVGDGENDGVATEGA